MIYDIRVPYIFVGNKIEGYLLLPSMILSTIVACALIEFIPQLMPMWMQLSSFLGNEQNDS